MNTRFQQKAKFFLTLSCFFACINFFFPPNNLSLFDYIYFEAIVLSSSRLLSSMCLSGKTHLLSSNSTGTSPYFCIILSFSFCFLLPFFVLHYFLFSPHGLFTLQVSLPNSVSLFTNAILVRFIFDNTDSLGFVSPLQLWIIVNL